jgi:hypothetical protein
VVRGSPPSTIVPLRRASVADRVARAFLPIACVRGYRYFVTKRVALGTRTASAVEAEVRGKRVQHVRLAVDEGRLATACSCSATLLGPAVCRHVWATLLEVDRQGALESLRATQRGLGLAPLADDQPRAQPRADEPSRSDTRDRPSSAKPAAPVKARARPAPPPKAPAPPTPPTTPRARKAAPTEARAKRAAARGRPR